MKSLSLAKCVLEMAIKSTMGIIWSTRLNGNSSASHKVACIDRQTIPGWIIYLFSDVL
jgi:hypothetical protein